MITLVSKITNLKPNAAFLSDLYAFFASCEGKYIEITLKRARSKRSDAQNRYYWGCVVPIIQAAIKDLGTLMTRKEVHDEILKKKFLNYELLANINGEEICRKYKSTTELTKTEFSEYIAQIQQWTAEILGVIIPDPNEQLEIL